MEVYYINGTDNYIKGFKVYYKEADGSNVSFELAGDQKADSNETGYVMQYVDFEEEGKLPAGFDYDVESIRLGRIQFKFVPDFYALIMNISNVSKSKY